MRSENEPSGANSLPIAEDGKAALIHALGEATKAAQWTVVTRLAELIAKMDDEPASVVELDRVRQERGRKK
jgi:hypothetical protein